jgi:large subunit ribosomal protein L21
MYAIIETGGKQYKVEKGSRLRVEKLPYDEGKDFEIPQVMLIKGEGDAASKIGTPFVEGSKVMATVVKQLRGPKIIVFKKRSKKGYQKLNGHRQSLTEIEIKDLI